MLFSLLKHYFELYITNVPAQKVSRSLHCFTTSIFHGVDIISKHGYIKAHACMKMNVT